MSGFPCRDFHVRITMSEFPCPNFHVHISMSIFSCSHFDVRIFMSTFTCLYFYVRISMSVYPCPHFHVISMSAFLFPCPHFHVRTFLCPHFHVICERVRASRHRATYDLGTPYTIQMWPPSKLHTAWWVVNETGKEVTFVSCMVCQGHKLLGVWRP